MAESPKTKSGGGCLGKLTALLGLFLFGGIAAAAWFISQPQDTSDIGGCGPAAAAAAAPRDIKAVLQSAVERRQPVSFTETEINQWLARTLVARQGGALASEATLDRVCVRLEDGRAELVTERTIFGRPFTVSMFLTIEQTHLKGTLRTEVNLHGGPYHPLLPKPPRGGRFGRLVVPQGFIILVLPACERLAKLYENELGMAFRKMEVIRIEANRVVLEPHKSRKPGGAPATF
jgi:hypothetical protein